MKKINVIKIIFIVLLVLIDQFSKVIVSNITNSIVIINNFLKFMYIKNYGAAFGMFSGSRIFIILFTLILICYLFYDINKNKKSSIEIFSCLLIICGAFGNLFDRVFLGYVRDFISFTLFGREMAIFNIADIYITFGVIIYIYSMIKDGINERNSNRK